MKIKVVFTVMGLAAVIACKKVKVEPVTPKEKNDTVVTKPAYWCVKSAVIKRKNFPDRYVQFRYNSKSQVIAVKEHPLETEKSGLVWRDTFLTTYTYSDDNLVYKMMEKSNGQKIEEFITYENGKIKKKEIKGRLAYYYEEFVPTVTTYDYAGNTISTTTSYPYYINVDELQIGTVTSTFRDYPDSSIAETYDSFAVAYYKEKLYKNDHKITIYEPKSTWVSYDSNAIVNNSDLIFLSQKEHRLDPIVWQYLNIYFPYDAFSNNRVYPVLLDIRHNKYFVESRGLKNKLIYKYQFDAENRVVNIKLENSEYEVSFTY